MGLGTNNRDYKTSANTATTGLAAHKVLMDRYIAKGETREVASSKAFDDLKRTPQRKRHLIIEEADLSGDLCQLCGTWTLDGNLVDAVCAYCRQRQRWEAKCNEVANA